MAHTSLMSRIPPEENERPAAYADRVGRAHAAHTTAAHKKLFGQYLTPLAVADFMARLCGLNVRTLRVLDPGAGTGVLACALCEVVAERRPGVVSIQLEAFECDALLTTHLDSCLQYAGRWLRERGVELNYHVRPEDFVLAHAQQLGGCPRPLFGEGVAGDFDVVVSNPPYFKIPKSDPRSKAASAVVHGQPNIYALFMATSAALLKPGGELIYIVPRSFAAGPYFRLFRERFFSMMRPQAVHLFGSRREAFGRDEVLQENVILLARRADGWLNVSDEGTVCVSFSNGIKDLPARRTRRVPVSEVLDVRGRDRVLRIPLADEDERITRAVRSWTGSLRDYGMDISTGPVVPFRTTQALSGEDEGSQTYAPLLWMQNVTPMRVEWPVEARAKEQYIEVTERTMPLLVPNRNYVLVRRFSPKEARRRLVAAPLLARDLCSPLLGLENHLNYVHRRGESLSEEEVYGLAALFNSAALDTYFRTFNGNTQVSATEVRAMPLPSLEVIRKIGARLARRGQNAEDVDAVVAESLGLGERRTASQVVNG